MKITARLALIVSGICSLIFVSFCFYKGLVLYFVSKAMEDTFAGGETSDVSIFLWFVVGVLLLFFTFLFFYFIKIKDLKSQKTLLNGIILFWIMISVIQIIFFKSYFYLILIYLIPIAINQFIVHFTSKEKLQKFIHKSDYFMLYKSGIAVYKNYPIFGVGNKNYRVETCNDKNDNNKYNYYCLTHPHQIYIEFLAEHGIVGTLILLSIFFTMMFKILLNILLSKNYIQIGSFCFVIFVFTPLLPSGSFLMILILQFFG